MTILVTGATGNVGRHVVEELHKAGHRVRALSRYPASAKLPAAVEVIGGDLSNPSTLAPALQGVSGLHLITTGTGYVPLTTGKEIIEAAEAAGVQRVSVLWDGKKGTVEHAVESSNLEWTQLQPVEYMSNVLNWRESIRTEGVVRDLYGDSLSAAIHEGDIGRVAAAALTDDGHAGKIYNLTGPEALTVQDKVRILSRLIGRDIQFIQLTEDQERKRMAELGVGKDIMDYVINWHMNPPVEAYSVEPAVKVVTGRPARTFAQWAQEHVNLFKV